MTNACIICQKPIIDDDDDPIDDDVCVDCHIAATMSKSLDTDVNSENAYLGIE